MFSHDRLRVECSSQTPRVDGRRGRVSRVRTAESYRECASRRAFLNRIALALAPRVCEHTRVQSAESARGTCLKPTRVRYPQRTHHTLYASFHSSEGPRKPKPVSQSHSRFSRRFGGTYSNLASRGSSHITHGSHLRLAEVPPRELEHFIHGIGRIHQQIRLP